MVEIYKLKSIILDYDGALMESNTIRDFGLHKVFHNYPSDQVEKIISYHKNNAGLSRYVKLRYFYDKIMCKKIMKRKQLVDYFL